MKTATIIVILALCLIGCSGSDANNSSATNTPTAASNMPDANNAVASSDPTGSTPGTVNTPGAPAPITSGAAGGMTPMTGTESVGGGGDGVGQAAKKMAKDKTAGGPSSLDQGEKDDSGQ